MLVKIFFCYAREDDQLMGKLKAHLKPLERQSLIDLWYDRNISAGSDWEQDIKEQLYKAQIILLLISPDFMNSDYCYGIEMQRAIERHTLGLAQVVPIILRHVYWQGVLGSIQALPKDAKPIIDRYWHSLDEAFYDVVEGIRELVEKINFKSLAFVPELAEEIQVFEAQGKKFQLNKESWDSVAISLSLKKQYTAALDAHKQAVLLDPVDALLYKYLGDTYFKNNQYNEALAAYEQAIFLRPDFGEAIYCKAAALERLGLSHDANVAYQRAGNLACFLPYCSHCGERFQDITARYCSECGGKVIQRYEVDNLQK